MEPSNNRKGFRMKKRYMILISAFFIIVSVTLFISFYDKVKQESIDNLNHTQMLHARQAAQGVEDFFDNWRRDLAVYSEIEDIKKMNERGKKFIESVYRSNAELIRAVTRVDARGRVMYTIPYDRKAIGRDISSQDHMRQIMKTHRPVVSDVFSMVQGFSSIALHVPVFSNGTFEGTIAIAVNFQALAKKYFEVIKVGKTGYAWVISRDGTELYCPVPGHVGNSVFTNCKDFPTILAMADEMLKQREGTATYTFDKIGEQSVYPIKKHAIYMPISIGNTFWSIVVASSEDEVLSSLAGFRNRLLIVIGIFLLGGVLFSYYGLKAWFVIQEQMKRRHTEEALRESERRFRSLVETTNDWVWECDENGIYTYASPKVKDIIGYEPEEVIGKRVYDFMDQNEARRVSTVFNNMIKLRSTFAGLENTNIRKDGQKVVLETNGVPIFDASGKFLGYRGIDRDISERKRLETQLRQSQKMEAIGTLAGGIAHDFNNILTALMGYATLIQMQMDPSNPLRPYVNQVIAASQKAADLTKSLLAFSRQQPVTLIPLSFNNTVKEAEKLLKRLLTEDIEFHISLCKDDPIVMADKSQIDQILFNLVTNARDSMPHGGTLTIETNLVNLDDTFRHFHGYGEKGTYALLSVSDTGTGMDEATRERIFDPFFTTKEVGKGTGLGLATVYGIVKQHNGYINTYSEPGMGTTFHVYFPIATQFIKESETISEPVRGGSETILIAEDSDAVRNLIKALLTEHGYTIIEAIDGEDAIQRFTEAKRIDLVILDTVMPKKNGREVYDEIIRLKPDSKVLFTSGYTRDVILDKGVEEGKFEFIQKPVSPYVLLKKVRQMLDDINELP